MVTQIIGPERPKDQGFSRESVSAKDLDAVQRQTLSVQALAGAVPVAELARSSFGSPGGFHHK